MAVHKSAIKRNRQNLKRRERNRMFKSMIKTFIKKTRIAVEEKDANKAKEYLSKVRSYLDKSVSKGILHRNNASRKISKLTRLVNSLMVKDGSQ